MSQYFSFEGDQSSYDRTLEEGSVILRNQDAFNHEPVGMGLVTNEQNF